MKLALVTPLPVPRVYGGMNRLIEGLHRALNEHHPTELIGLDFDERRAEGVLKGYYDFYHLDLSRFDAVISCKAPAYMVRHPVHVHYLSHRLRVFYDLYEPRNAQHAQMRRLVHWMDNWALDPGRMPHLFTIGRTVSRRLQRYGGIPSTPIHLPSTLESLPWQPGEYFFAAGRLHEWKRFDLVIKAFRASSSTVPLVIAGSGPQEQELRELAAGDDRIRLVGHVEEQELREYYARALAVIFPPIHEDLGLITFEAFGSGKPVLTVPDAGEPAEIIEHGKTGFIVDPKPGALAEQISWMAAHPDELAGMREDCEKAVAQVTWERVAENLLGAIDTKRSTPVTLRQGASRPERIHLLVTDNQILDPPTGGGRIRIRELYRHLPEDFSTIYVGAHDHPGPAFRDQRLEHNLREVVTPLTAVHFKAHEVWRRLTRGEATVDVTLPLLLGWCSPRYGRLVRQFIEEADLLIASHPWVTPFLPEAPGLTFVYDAHNCEASIKQGLLQGSLAGRYLARRVRQTERMAVDRAELVLACSTADIDAFEQLYGKPREAMMEVPNGVDCQAIQPGHPGERPMLRAELDLPAGPMGVFAGSQYGPNLAAVAHLVRSLAPRVPEVTVVIIGGAGPAWHEADPAPLPPNVRILGQVETERMIHHYRAADFGLNPMTMGSGTNIKMLDFMAAGLAIVSTPTGARGLAGQNDRHWVEASIEQFDQAVVDLVANPDRWRALGEAARMLAEQTYHWGVIAERLAGPLRRLPARRRTSEDWNPLHT